MFNACVFGVLLAVAACNGKKEDATAAAPIEEKGIGGETLSRLTEIKTKMCACADPACAQGVIGELTAFNTKPAVKLTKTESAAVTKISAELATCLQNANAPSGESEKK